MQCNWLCYSRLFGDCLVFFGRTAKATNSKTNGTNSGETKSGVYGSPESHTESTALSAAAAAALTTAAPPLKMNSVEQRPPPRRTSQPTATLSSLGETLRETLYLSRRKSDMKQSAPSTEASSLEASPAKVSFEKMTVHRNRSPVSHSHSLPSEVEKRINRIRKKPPTVKHHRDSSHSQSTSDDTDDTVINGSHSRERHGSGPMDTGEWRDRGKEMVDYIAEYIDTIGDRRVTPADEPGYLSTLIPSEAPYRAEDWDTIMTDFEQHIMPGVTHWQHPRFHAYFPAGNSYPSILADMITDAIGCIGFSWAASPACTGLEVIMLDWVGRMIGLPSDFLCFDGQDKSRGGGVIQGSASDCVLICLLAARHAAIKALKQKHPFVEDGVLLSKLMAYCSKESHSCVEKAAMIGFVKLRILDTDEKFQLRGTTLANAMDEDKKAGLEPFFVSTTLGTTSCCSFDVLHEIGPVCADRGVWLHVNAAYAGNSFVCPEFQYLLKGVELTQAMVVDPLYLQHSYSDKSIDYRHWGIPLSRRFRSLKLWFVIRNYGIEGLQKYVREHCRLAKSFEQLVKADSRFEVLNEVILGLVCFRLKGSNNLNQRLLSAINASGKLHMVPASLNGKFVIRTTDQDIEYAYKTIGQFADDMYEILRLDSKAREQEDEYQRELNKDAKPEKEEDESADEVLVLDRKKQMSLRYKRSFFVRMVSDPKLYNPKIVRALGGQGSSGRLDSDERENSEDVVTPL